MKVDEVKADGERRDEQQLEDGFEDEKVREAASSGGRQALGGGGGSRRDEKTRALRLASERLAVRPRLPRVPSSYQC